MSDLSPMLRRTIDSILKAEGGYVNNPADRGGPTNYGITERVARENGYQASMAAMPEQVAREIYATRYIVRPGFDKVDAISRSVADELVDTGVNMGPGTAAKFLQRALNALNRGGKDYPDCEVDGRIGSGTLAALTTFIEIRGREGERCLVVALNSQQCMRYIELCEHDPAQEAFAFGWISNRVVLPAN